MKKNLLCILLALSLLICALSACARTETQSQKSYTGEEEIDFSKYFDDNGRFIDIKASKLVTLPEYKGVAIPAEVMTADEAAVQEQLDSILDNFAEYEQVTDRAVSDGDTVSIDYVGSIDGVEFDGGSTGGMGTFVTIGVTSYIDDFLEQLIGHMPGETVNVEVTFPESYPNNPDLENKDAVFVTTINFIQGEKIEKPLTDDMIAQYTGGQITSVDAMRDYFEDAIVSDQKTTWYQDLVLSAQCDNVPDIVTELVTLSAIQNYRQMAQSYNMSMEDLIAASGYASLDELLADSAEEIKANACSYLAVQAISEKEKLFVTDEDLENAGFTSDMIDTYGRGYLCFALLQSDIVPEFIFENSVAG